MNKPNKASKEINDYILSLNGKKIIGKGNHDL